MKIEKNIGLVDVTNEEYHSSDSVGHSGLVRIMRSPSHYKESLDAPREPTPAMAFGTAVHAAILEPSLFVKSYGVAPKFDRRTKDGKAAAEDWEKNNAGKLFLTEEQMASLKRMQAQVMDHAGAAKLLSVGMAEKSFFWTDSETGVNCRIRPDFLMQNEHGEIIGIVDVKTAIDASAEGFSKSLANYGYDLQAAFYQEGMKQATGRKIPFYFVVIESNAPHAVAAYKANDQVIEVGRTKFQGALQLVAWCRENGQWPAYQPTGEIEEIGLPRWAANFSLDD